MKTKMMKKLISVVCALAMATSCAAMSVGASPNNIAGVLMYRVHAVEAGGFDMLACYNLANELEAFFNSDLCINAVFGSGWTYKDGFAENVSFVLNHLRSNNWADRQAGAGQAIDNLGTIAEVIYPNIH